MQISKDIHFERDEQGAVYLNKAGKIVFIKELEKKLYQKVKINGVSRTYDSIIKMEVQKLIRTIRDDEKYKPYKYT